jgi:hypothetical protein
MQQLAEQLTSWQMDLDARQSTSHDAEAKLAKR